MRLRNLYFKMFPKLFLMDSQVLELFVGYEVPISTVWKCFDIVILEDGNHRFRIEYFLE